VPKKKHSAKRLALGKGPDSGSVSISIQKISPYLSVIIIDVELIRLDVNIDIAMIFIEHVDVASTWPNLGAIIIDADFTSYGPNDIHAHSPQR
jgi:hypothetical protein